MSRTRKRIDSKAKSGPKSVDQDGLSASEASKSKLNEVKSVSRINESDILKLQTNDDLIMMIDKLTGTAAEELFKVYKKKVEEQMSTSEKLIMQLTEDLDRKQKMIDELQNKVQNMHLVETPVKEKQSETKIYKSPIRRKKNSASGEDYRLSKNDLAKELENIGITLDMLELLTGLRIINYEEDDKNYHFEVKQSSTKGTDDEITVVYKLVISKEFSDTAEITYIPTFLNSLENSLDTSSSFEKNEVENSELLMKILPDYFCDHLTFPYNTLSSFYSKMNRSLTKRKSPE